MGKAKLFDFGDDAAWRKRFLVPKVQVASTALRNAKKGVVSTDKDGVMQLYAWDIASGDLQQRTGLPSGLRSGIISADGEWIVYQHDAGGSELGHLNRVSWNGGEPVDLTPDLPDYSVSFMTSSSSSDLIGFTYADKDGFHSRAQKLDGSVLFTVDKPVISNGPIFVSGGEYAVILTAEQSGTTDYAIEVRDAMTGELVEELWDGEGVDMNVGHDSRIRGDGWLLISSNKTGYERPGLWNPKTLERRDFAAALGQIPGDLRPVDWSPDGRYILLTNIYRAEQQLYVLNLENDEVQELPIPAGTISGAGFRDSSITYVYQNAERPSEVCEISLERREVNVLLQLSDVLPGRPYKSVFFNSADGTEIQAWLATPEGEGPFPTIVHTHGGPRGVATNFFSPAAQAWLDHGFACFTINYRGSTTFGADFMNAINGDLGNLEVQDVEAGVNWLLENKIADPSALFKTGASYGGYLTLQSLGKLPELWAGGMAVVAIADWNLMYEDQSDSLRGFQRSIFGGGPDTMSEQYTKSSPITYLEDVQAPLLIIQGRNDTRCPSRQMEKYLEKADKLDKKVSVHWFEAGHGSLAKKDQIAQQQMAMEFVEGILQER